MTRALGRVMVVTGSGISADSGIPTFRGKDGYWRNLDPQRLATAAAFANDPGTVWEWYRERRDLIRRSAPNAAHEALVELETHARDFMLLTQNVDDLHGRARYKQNRMPDGRIVQIHGDIFVTRCIRCELSYRETTEVTTQGVPVCPRCGAPMRPGVVWFDEELDPGQVQRVQEYLRNGPCDVVVVVGTTAGFDYIVDWALRARGQSGRLIEINPAETPLSRYATQVIREPAATALPPLVKQLCQAPSEQAPTVSA